MLRNATPLPADCASFPEFTASDTRSAQLLNDLFRRHYFALPGPSAYTGDQQSDWRAWNALSTEWLDTAANPAHGRDYNRDLAHFLEHVELDADGYVYTYPPTFRERNRIGWPFPDYRQSHGATPAWNFTTDHTHGWQRVRGTGAPEGDRPGWALTAEHGEIEIVSPRLKLAALHAPLLAVQWHGDGAVTGVCQWQAAGGQSGTVPFRLPPPPNGDQALFLPLWPSVPRDAILNRLTLRLYLEPAATIVVQRIEPLFDTRHNTNNSHFVLAAWHHARWGADRAFLMRILPRVRLAMAHLHHDHGGRRYGLLQTPWWGHDGQTGLGHGIGSNYWDLLPFGHRDLYGTAYYLAALRSAAEMEALIARHPAWGAEPAPRGMGAAALRAHATRVRHAAAAAFWDEQSGRFIGTIDREGQRHDYGFVFANLEALYCGLGDQDQARRIYDWLDGRRLVAGDRSQGEDIYHFRFAPRATTRDNRDWYFWGWNGKAVPWGDQVQNGGAVLYTSFHDILNRLKFAGADDAWSRLAGVLDWYTEVLEAGGYRAYYQDHEGRLQGAGTAGGLGLDAEFVESALVPLVTVYGFLGLEATAAGLVAQPRLPKGLERLGVRNLRYGAARYDLEAGRDWVTIAPAGGTPRRLRVGDRPRLLVPAAWEGTQSAEADHPG